VSEINWFGPLSNLLIEDFNIPDPVLSKKGEQQCRALRDHLRAKQPLAQKIELIVASPLRRTLQTAQLSLDWLIEEGVNIIPLAKLQGL
jgi:broad specificity phosphatase PhoE